MRGRNWDAKDEDIKDCFNNVEAHIKRLCKVLSSLYYQTRQYDMDTWLYSVYKHRLLDLNKWTEVK